MLEARIEEMSRSTEADRKITYKPWLSMQKSKNLTRPLAGVKGEVC
jgi:hypothetical protein